MSFMSDDEESMQCFLGGLVIRSLSIRYRLLMLLWTFMLATLLLSCAHLLFYKLLPVLQIGDVQKHLVII